MTAISLGDQARDTITGLTGTIVSRHEYLNGCVRLCIQPKELKDGRPVEATVIDIQQLELLETAKPTTVVPAGGPHDEPARQSVPSR